MMTRIRRSSQRTRKKNGQTTAIEERSLTNCVHLTDLTLGAAFAKSRRDLTLRRIRKPPGGWTNRGGRNQNCITQGGNHFWEGDPGEKKSKGRVAGVCDRFRRAAWSNVGGRPRQVIESG